MLSPLLNTVVQYGVSNIEGAATKPVRTAEEASAEAASSSSDQDAAEGVAEAGWRHSMTEVPPYVAVVQERHEALRVANLLSTRYRNCTFGADTEVRSVGRAGCSWTHVTATACLLADSSEGGNCLATVSRTG
jgi:hypothetical protein